uniref:phage tail tape measure protein n=1 Tax=Martelella sp. HB161492 TaxID=2720726 RepID=UPI0015902040
MSRPDIPVKIGADDTEFKSAMTRIRMQARTAANDTASSFLAIKSKIGGLDNIFGMLQGGPAGLAASLGLGAFVASTHEAVDAVTSLGKAAKTAGVDFEAFQELSYAAVKSKIDVDALTDGLKEMQLRADEFVKTGGGSAAESFQRLGLSARDLTRMLNDPAKMFDTLISKIRQLDKAAQIRVLDEMFGGTAAEQFSSLMDDSAQSIADARQEARDLGAVMDEDVLHKAEEVNAKWEAMAMIIGTRVKSNLVEVAGLVSDLVTSLGSFQTKLAEIGNSSVWTKLGTFLGVDMSKTMKWVDGQGWTAQDDVDLGSINVSNDDPVARRMAELDDYNSGREALETKLAANRKVSAEIDHQNSLTADQLSLEQEIERIRAQYTKAGGSATEEELQAKAEASLAAKKARLAETRKSGGASTTKEKDAVKDLIQALQDELDMSTMSAEQKKVFENLRRAGADATEDERAAIEKLTLSIDEQGKKQEQAAETAAFFRDTAYDSFQSVIPAIETGNDALDTLINKLIEAAAQAAILGTGPLAGLFGGGLFASGSSQSALAAAGKITGLFASGTDFAPGGTAIVGEKGPELVNLPRGSQVIPNHRLGAALES